MAETSNVVVTIGIPTERKVGQADTLIGVAVTSALFRVPTTIITRELTKEEVTDRIHERFSCSVDMIGDYLKIQYIPHDKDRLRTLAEWSDKLGVEIIDADGFDRRDPHLMEHKFTRKEFLLGLQRCTINPGEGGWKKLDEAFRRTKHVHQD